MSAVSAAPIRTRPTVVPGGGIPLRLIIILTIATGATAANLYYIQPLLHTLALDFGASEGTAGLAVTATQIGYALGLAFVVPLGDLVSRRRLSFGMLALTTVMLLGAAAGPNIGLVIAALGIVGLGAVVAQVLVPLAAEMSTPKDRGHVVGTVMAGLLLGILGARILSGAIGEWLGWRAVLVVGAGIAAVLAAVLWVELPSEGERPRVSYPGLLRSALRLIRDVPSVRHASVIGALTMASFAVFWTAIAFRLGGDPFNYSDTTIGLLGIAGLAGAVAASRAGRLGDRGHAPIGRFVMSLIMAGSYVMLLVSGDHIWIVIVATITLDAGIQGAHVLNQSVIYNAAPEAPSRVTSVYMTTYFVGGACGSALAAQLFDHSGWAAVCIAGIALGVLAAIFSAVWPDGGTARTEASEASTAS